MTGWKRAQLVIRPDPPWELRFAGPVEAQYPYRVDDVFRCQRGHRRVEATCTCGFYAVTGPDSLKPSVVPTALLEVALEGRVVRHPHCLRGERQRIRAMRMDGWCAFCVRPAAAVAGVAPLFTELPRPWRRAVPVCDRDWPLFDVVLTFDEVADRLPGVDVVWDRTRESNAARSLRRLLRARGGGAP